MELNEMEKWMLYQTEGSEWYAILHDIRRNYRLPKGARTVGEMLAEARQKSGAEQLKGHDILAQERFDPEVRYMVIFEVLSGDSFAGDDRQGRPALRHQPHQNADTLKR